MACEDQISTTDLINSKLDVITQAEIATSREGGVSTGDLIFESTDRFGNIHLTSEGALARIQANPINGGVWAVGITFNAYNDYMIYSGVAYKPIQSTVLPYVSEATPNVANVEPFTIVDPEQATVTMWDAGTTYNLKDIVTDDINGWLYTATTTTVGVQPSTDDTGDWIGAAVSIAIDAVEGDTIVSTAVNNRLRIQQNLSDLANTSTARTNLDVYSKAEVYSKSEADLKAIKAYLRYDSFSPTAVITESNNIATIVDNGVGSLAFTFTTAMADANYIAVGNASQSPSTACGVVSFIQKTTAGFSVISRLSATDALYDFPDVSVIITGNGGV